MFIVTDKIVKEILSATHEEKIDWGFKYATQTLTGEYKDMEIVLKHTIEESMRYNHLALAVFTSDGHGVYSSHLNIDLDGTITSNPAYDLLLDIKETALETIRKIDEIYE